MIDWPFIQQNYQNIFEEVSALVPLEQWHIKPKSLQSTKHKTKYGMADINGVIFINEAFVGTETFQLLEATIRHELAHLCVGIHHGHDIKFKNQAKLFKASFGRHLAKETKEFNQSIGFKYKLYATFNDEQVILFKRVHRKHSKYLDYKPSFFSYLSIGGHKVKRFHYELI